MKTRYRLDEQTGKVLFEAKFKIRNRWEWKEVREAKIEELFFKFVVEKDSDYTEGEKNEIN